MIDKHLTTCATIFSNEIGRWHMYMHDKMVAISCFERNTRHSVKFEWRAYEFSLPTYEWLREESFATYTETEKWMRENGFL